MRSIKKKSTEKELGVHTLKDLLYNQIFYTILREKLKAEFTLTESGSRKYFLNFVKAKHTRRNFEGQLCPELKRVTEGGWTFLFKLANYQTITRTFANSYTCEYIVRREKLEWVNFCSMIVFSLL